MSIAQRTLEPFDINVVTSAATSIMDIEDLFEANEGAASGEFDAWVPIVEFRDQSIASVGSNLGAYGIASAIDLLVGTNATDETAVVFAENFIGGPFPLDFALANVAVHEAGHTWGLRHSNARFSANQDLLTSSDIMVEGGGSGNDLLGPSQFTRYNMMKGDGNTNQKVTTNAYNQLTTDSDIGLRANAPAYVTGTGAFDTITISPDSGSMVNVSVKAYTSNERTTQIGMTTYSVSIDQGLLIEAGFSDDLVVIDSAIPVNVTVRGGLGSDTIQLTGNADSITHTLSPNEETPLLDEDFKITSQIHTGTMSHTIISEEMEPVDDSVPRVGGAATSWTIQTGDEADRIDIAPGAVTGTTRIAFSPVRSFTFPNPSMALILETGEGDDAVAIGGLGTGFTAAVTIDTQGGADTVRFQEDVSAGALTVHAETILLHGDRITTTADQTYDGSVFLGADTTLNAANVTFNGTVDAKSGGSATDYLLTSIGYDFEDISTSGTALSLGDDQTSSAISLGFDFTFFDVGYNQIFVRSNGYVTFVGGPFSPTDYIPKPIPNTAVPNAIIAGWYEDLDPSSGAPFTTRYWAAPVADGPSSNSPTSRITRLLWTILPDR